MYQFLMKKKMKNKFPYITIVDLFLRELIYQSNIVLKEKSKM